MADDYILNEHTNWQQGRFVDGPRYKHMGRTWKAAQVEREVLLVRPSPLGNPICTAATPEDAAWIAKRLNLAATLEAEKSAKTQREGADD